MSDDDRDNDIESDADKRAHHNALERKRRDHIKDSFSSLRDSLPAFQGDKVREDYTWELAEKKKNLKREASRAQILKKAADYIQSMRRKNSAHQQDIDDLRRQNKILEEQIRTLEKAKATGNFAAAAAVIEANLANSKAGAISTFEADSESDDSSDTDESKDGRRKRLKTTLDSQLR